MGSGHFLRAGFPAPPGLPRFSIEEQLRGAGAMTYLIVVGTNAVGGYDDLDHRFDSWPTPVIVSLAGNWVGELLALPVVTGGVDPGIGSCPSTHSRPRLVNSSRKSSKAVGKILEAGIAKPRR